MRLRVNHPEGRGSLRGDSPGAVQRGCPNQNPLDLIQADGVISAVMQLGGARGLVSRYLSTVLTTHLSQALPSGN